MLNHKYLVLDNNTRYFIFTGGRGSGKSFAVSLLALLLTLEKKYTHKILFTRYTLRSASISIIPEFKEKIELLGYNHLFKITKDEIINIETGSSILFRGIKTASGDQTANLKSLQGITTWIIDEAEEMTDENTFDKIDLSVREKDIKNRIILIMNPTTKEHWIYTRFFQNKGISEGSNITKDNVTYVHTTYQDNKENLSDSFIKQIEDMKTRRPEKYKHQMLGGWLAKAEGVIFTNWEIGEFKEVGQIVLGQDFGFASDPSSLCMTSIDKQNKKIYLKECFYLPRLTTSEIAKLNKQYAGENLIVADSAEPRLIAELKAHCNIIPSIKGQGSITYGISLLQDYDLIIDPNSINLIKELNNYSWLEKKSRTPQDAFNHLIDGIRYSISYQLQNPNRGTYYIS